MLTTCPKGWDALLPVSVGQPWVPRLTQSAPCLIQIRANPTPFKTEDDRRQPRLHTLHGLPPSSCLLSRPLQGGKQVFFSSVPTWTREVTQLLTFEHLASWLQDTEAFALGNSSQLSLAGQSLPPGTAVLLSSCCPWNGVLGRLPAPALIEPLAGWKPSLWAEQLLAVREDQYTPWKVQSVCRETFLWLKDEGREWAEREAAKAGAKAGAKGENAVGQQRQVNSYAGRKGKSIPWCSS